MALIERFIATTHERHSVHDPVECGYKVFDHKDGRRIVQFDTYGSPGRAEPGKVSQSIQSDERRSARMMEILRRAFPHLG